MHVLIGTAGHIDHGKTSLVRRLTGIDTDRLPEEKARGISIDLGFAHFEAAEFCFGVVDVPGHERFVRNMVAGATGVDLALLVVAADDSVMPQTVEHLEIMDLLGVTDGVIALTKTDAVDPELVELVAAEVAERVRGTFLERAPVVPVSSVTGAGFDALQDALVAVARRRAWPARGELFHMPIDRVFSLAGHGTIVTGSVIGGAVQAGQTLELLPEQRPVRVRSVQSHGQGVEASGERTRTALNLAAVRADELRRGQDLAAPGYLRPARRLLVRVRNLAGSPVVLRDRLALNLHLGTGEAAARLVTRGATIPPGGEGFVELRTAAPVAAAWGQRFILRRASPALTVAGGVILDPGVELRRRLPDLAARGSALQVAEERARLSLYLAEQDVVEASPLAAAWRVGVAPSRYAGLVRELTADGILQALPGGSPGALLHRDRLQQIGAALRTRIATELRRHQPRRSLPRKTLLAACRRVARAELVEAAFAELVRRGDLVAIGPNFGPADAQVQLSKNQQALRARLLSQIDAGGLAPPNLKELAAALAQKPEAIQSLLTVCVEDGLLIDVGDGLHYPPVALDQARQTCAALLAAQGSATMSQLREAWGVTRKYSVPLCEYFDSRKITVRDGDQRRAGANLATPLA